MTKPKQVTISAEQYEKIVNVLSAFSELKEIIDALDNSPSAIYEFLWTEAGKIIEDMPPLQDQE